MDDDELGDVWDKVGGDAPEPDAADTGAEQVEVDMGPPVRVTFIIKAERIPVAPWAQGWRVGAIGPEGGHVTLVCEHDIDLSPVAQLSAVTGLLGTLKQAQLEVMWWTIQSRGPLELGASGGDDIDAELQQLLEDADADDDQEA
jgi:hypothetical protein